MRTCLKVPRIFLPRGGFEIWATPPRETLLGDEGMWERVARTTGNAPSAFHFFQKERDRSRRDGMIECASDIMYEALEEETLERVGVGFVLTERKTSSGVRYGFVAAVDLELYSCEEGKKAPVRATIPPTGQTDLMRAFRAGQPLEFPDTTLFYRDKKDKAVRWFLKEKGDLLYRFPLMEGGGEIAGYFIPEDSAYAAIGEFSFDDVGLAVADGHDSIAAAKLHWDSIKAGLTEREKKTHPARFYLAELVNVCSPAVSILPAMRRVSTEEPDVFRDFFRRNLKCKIRDGNIYPGSSDFSSIAEADSVIDAYLSKNGGKVRFEGFGAREEGDVDILFEEPQGEAIFSAVKGGKLLPRAAFRLPMEQKRFSLEGREISYD